jgi:hypothetical protein
MVSEWGDLKRLNDVRQAGLQFGRCAVKENDLLDTTGVFQDQLEKRIMVLSVAGFQGYSL